MVYTIYCKRRVLDYSYTMISGTLQLDMHVRDDAHDDDR